MVDVFDFSSISSTNDYAKILLDGRKSVIVSAKYQTKGRGRNNKRWVGDYGGNIFLSYGIRYDDGVQEISQEMMRFQAMGCLAVKAMLKKLAPQLRVVLKYPNDVYAQQEKKWLKISGILVENEFIGANIKSSILGIGVNCSQSDFSDGIAATSLQLLGMNEDVARVKKMIIDEIHSYIRMEYQKVIMEWKNELNIIGKTIIRLDNSSSWVAHSFDDFGMLVAFNGDEKAVISNGDSIRYNLG